MSGQVKRAFENLERENTFVKVAQHSIEYQRKALAVTEANMEAVFDCVQDLVKVRSPSEFIEVTIEHVRRRFEAVAEQTKELALFAQPHQLSQLSIDDRRV